MPLPLRVTLVKEFQYRGEDEEWSNTYGLSGGPLPDYGAMLALVNNIASFERNAYVAEHKIVRAYIYQPGSIVADRMIDFAIELGSTQAGLLSVPETACGWAGDQAGWLRGKIGVNSKGRPKYVRKYYHGGTSVLADPDLVTPTWKNGIQQIETALTSGGFGGGRLWVGPNGQPVTLTHKCDMVTTRTLKRRGRRPTPSDP